jgi:hypothetical protein
MSVEDHIRVTRLEQLSREAIIAVDEEVRHLRVCEECQTLLRILVNQHRATRYASTPVPDKKSA